MPGFHSAHSAPPPPKVYFPTEFSKLHIFSSSKYSSRLISFIKSVQIKYCMNQVIMATFLECIWRNTFFKTHKFMLERDKV